MESILFGRIIENLNLEEAMYIMNSDNYKITEIFKKKGKNIITPKKVKKDMKWPQGREIYIQLLEIQAKGYTVKDTKEGTEVSLK